MKRDVATQLQCLLKIRMFKRSYKSIQVPLLMFFYVIFIEVIAVRILVINATLLKNPHQHNHKHSSFILFVTGGVFPPPEMSLRSFNYYFTSFTFFQELLALMGRIKKNKEILRVKSKYTILLKKVQNEKSPNTEFFIQQLRSIKN